MQLTKIITADYLTTVTVFLRLQGENKCLLESIPRDKTKGRYSIIGVNPIHEIKVVEGVFTIDQEEIKTDDPLRTLSDLVVTEKSSSSKLPFTSGAIGYVGFDMFSFYEDLPNPPVDELNIPDCHFYLFESFVVFDHTKETLTLVQDNCYSKRSEDDLKKALKKMVDDLRLPSSMEHEELNLGPLDFQSNLTKEEYMSMVKRAKEYIQQGDLFQLVPSQRLSASFPYDAFDYYRKLRVTNPSSYLYFLDFDETKVIGSSPESLVSVKGEIVSTNPIAGTSIRGETTEEDLLFEGNLLANEKELAEHRMLVDLGRNDIGKIALTGSVSVPVYMVIEKYRFIMHIVSVVTGKRKPEVSAMDALKATFPADTVSGAPKIRAVQRLYEMEPVKRNLYAGAVGYLTKEDDADFAIAIRTMVLVNDVAHVQAGAGVVYDSDPETEYYETLNKAKTLLEVTTL